MFDKFAEELKAAREKKGLTLHQVSLKTKIDYKFLEVMEDGDFSFLPELYVKAFLKSYGNVVGIDEDIIIKKYEAAKTGKQFEELESGSLETEQKSLRKETPKYKKPSPEYKPVKESMIPMDKKKYLIAGAAFIIVLAAVIYYLFSNSNPEIIVTEKPLNEIVEENQQRYLEEEKTPVDNNQNLSDSLLLNIISSETSWVKITYDDKNTGEFTLLPMSQKNVKAAQNFRIVFGNARGIKLKLNGNELKFDASKKAISNVVIDSSGLRYTNAQQ